MAGEVGRIRGVGGRVVGDSYILPFTLCVRCIFMLAFLVCTCY